jgi:hypothetical protein
MFFFVVKQLQMTIEDIKKYQYKINNRPNLKIYFTKRQTKKITWGWHWQRKKKYLLKIEH